MPSGRTHDRITLWCIPALAAVTYQATHSPQITGIVTGSFLFSGLMFGPDLDIHSKQYKRWGPVRWIWLPYRKSMRHRSVLSHGPLVGTTVRIAYLLLLLLLLWLMVIAGWAVTEQWLNHRAVGWDALSTPLQHQFTRQLAQSLEGSPALWASAFVGLELGALSHIISDHVVSACKRLLRGGKRRAKH
jgi:uncharacterized metal-binding protein